MPNEEVANVDGRFMNVAETAVLYDTIAITADLPNLAIQPPGWFATFAAFGPATNHVFFNVRNKGNCESPYCNLDARDQLPFAFRAESIGLSFWACAFAFQEDPDVAGVRYWLPSAIWQADIPIHGSLTLRVQQDEKLKVNCAELTPGFGPTGGGYGNLGDSTPAVAPEVCQFAAISQGVPVPRARFEFPDYIDMPRRSSLAAYLNFSEYGRQLITALPGPFGAPLEPSTWDGAVFWPVMVGVTCALFGRRLVQQRGELHA